MSVNKSPVSGLQTIPEIIAQYPYTKAVFEQFGIQPDGYKSLEYEDLSATCRVHQIDLAVLLAALNQAISE